MVARRGLPGLVARAHPAPLSPAGTVHPRRRQLKTNRNLIVLLNCFCVLMGGPGARAQTRIMRPGSTPKVQRRTGSVPGSLRLAQPGRRSPPPARGGQGWARPGRPTAAAGPQEHEGPAGPAGPAAAACRRCGRGSPLPVTVTAG